MRMYVKALKNSRTDNIKPFLLIIEEINRANVAAVFGDIFQLLDRGDDFVSEYPIQATEDVKKYLAKELGGDPCDYNKIKIPDNMFIWATMNSADQGVFPMDTAFKRRWDFTYLGIDDNDQDLQGKYVYLADDKSQKVEWNKLRKAINNFLAKEKINILNREVLSADTWTEKSILHRAEILADILIEEFKYIEIHSDTNESTELTFDVNSNFDFSNTKPGEMIFVGEHTKVSSWADLLAKTMNTAFDLDAETITDLATKDYSIPYATRIYISNDERKIRKPTDNMGNSLQKRYRAKAINFNGSEIYVSTQFFDSDRDAVIDWYRSHL